MVCDPLFQHLDPDTDVVSESLNCVLIHHTFSEKKERKSKLVEIPKFKREGCAVPTFHHGELEVINLHGDLELAFLFPSFRDPEEGDNFKGIRHGHTVCRRELPDLNVSDLKGKKS